jgi:hypothetical protein
MAKKSDKKSRLITLTAKRVKETTGLYKGYNRTEYYKPDGTLYATVPAESKQPRKDAKTVIINCFRWAVEWV